MFFAPVENGTRRGLRLFPPPTPSIFSHHRAPKNKTAEGGRDVVPTSSFPLCLSTLVLCDWPHSPRSLPLSIPPSVFFHTQLPPASFDGRKAPSSCAAAEPELLDLQRSRLCSFLLLLLLLVNLRCPLGLHTQSCIQAQG